MVSEEKKAAALVAARGETVVDFGGRTYDLEALPVEQWPACYREIYLPTIPEPVPGKRHVACIGDSITFGAGVILPEELFDATYPAFLQKELGEGVQVLNYGFGGRTLLKEGDWPYTREEIYEASLKAQAEVYVIMLGTNDSKPQNWDAGKFREELEALVRVYQALPSHPTVYLMTPPKAFVVEGAREVAYDIREEVIEEEIPLVYETAKATGATLIDLFAHSKDHPEWFPDGVHPGVEGNLAFARIIGACLKGE